MQESLQKKHSFIPPAPAPKDSATGFMPPRFPLQAQAKPPSASKKATRPYSSYERDLIQAKLLEGMDEAIQRQAQAQAIQSKCAHCEAEDAGQRKEDGEAVSQKLPQEIATDGFRGTPRQLPHLDKIQRSFGQDLSHVQAFIGGKATAASVQLGAAAYTCGNRIAFAKTPSIEQYGNHYKQKADRVAAGVASISLALDNSVSVQRLVKEKNLLEKHNYGSSNGKQLREPNPQPGPPPPVIENKKWRISSPTPPGWVSLESGYIGSFHIPGAPVELPHTIALFSRLSAFPDGTRFVKILEGRYKDKDAQIKTSTLVPFYSFNRPANMTFQKTSEDLINIYGRFSYGSNASVNGIIDATNPVPPGKHDIEIPDFQHNEYGAAYGDFGTTWFRIGHSGDRYLHPGQVSEGCVTITQYSEWSSIWSYLINSRKDDRSVGEIEIKL